MIYVGLLRDRLRDRRDRVTGHTARSSIMPGKSQSGTLCIGHPSRGSRRRLRRDDYALLPNGEFRIECDDTSCYA